MSKVLLTMSKVLLAISKVLLTMSNEDPLVLQKSAPLDTSNVLGES